MTPTVGEFLKRARLERSLSQRGAAKLVGISQARVAEAERMIDGNTGKPFVPSYMLLLKFARGYGLPPDELLRMAGHEPGIELEAEEWRLIKGYRALPRPKRDHLFQVLEELLAAP